MAHYWLSGPLRKFVNPCYGVLFLRSLAWQVCLGASQCYELFLWDFLKQEIALKSKIRISSRSSMVIKSSLWNSSEKLSFSCTGIRSLSSCFCEECIFLFIDKVKLLVCFFSLTCTSPGCVKYHRLRGNGSSQAARRGEAGHRSLVMEWVLAHTADYLYTHQQGLWGRASLQGCMPKSSILPVTLPASQESSGRP